LEGDEVENLIFELRSMPVWLLKSYLEEIGGHPDSNNCYSGEGWFVTLEKMEDYKIGALSVGQVRLNFFGEKKAIENVLPLLEKKMMRAGG
jgi:hypothetical protein